MREINKPDAIRLSLEKHYLNIRWDGEITRGYIFMEKPLFSTAMAGTDERQYRRSVLQLCPPLVSAAGYQIRNGAQPFGHA